MDEVSDYQKFKQARLNSILDDDNASAHFSGNYSQYNRTQRDMNTFRSSVKESLQQPGINTNRLTELQLKYDSLNDSYQLLKSECDSAKKEAKKYKDLYEQKLEKQILTKAKLKNWVKEAKLNLEE